MTFHIGLDFGTRRLAYAIPDSCKAGFVKLKDSGPYTVAIEEAGRQLGDWLLRQDFISLLDPEEMHFWAERPVVGRPHGNVRTAVGQALTVGGVLSQLPGSATLIEQAEWKKAIVGNGHASKDDIRTFLDTTHPALAAACRGEQDVYDATCIALYGMAGGRGVP